MMSGRSIDGIVPTAETWYQDTKAAAEKLKGFAENAAQKQSE